MGGCETSKQKILSSKAFFNMDIDDSDITMNNAQKYKTPVKLEFTLDGCEINHKYQINIQSKENPNIFSTESAIVKQNIVTFNSCYICQYFFEKQQYLNLHILKDGTTYKTLTPSLGAIVGSPQSTYRENIAPNREDIIINAQSINNTNSFINFHFKVNSNSNIDFSNINNKISFRIFNRGRLVYQSESISSYGNFNPIRVPIAILEPDFTVTFLNSKQEVLIFKDETISSFTEQKNLIYLGLFVNNNQINIINNSEIFRYFTFIDYIKNGVTIKLTIGIDFTSSNKSPTDPESLHYLGGGMNDYELAIRSCGSVLAHYDYNQSIPVYGFGAVINGHHKPNMCFHINFKKDPEIYTINNVIQEYHNCFRNITLAGPTEFCPLIQKVNEKIKKENNPLKYHILMILTDGIIVDQQKTIDALVEGSFLPLSVIIIGIGDDHFQEMIQLDGDDIPLVSSTGIKRMRDLVQFVPFDKYRDDPDMLAEQVLEEVPRQIMEYYTMNKIYPHNLAMSQLNQFKENKNIYENNNNTYKNYINVSNNNTYKSYLNMNIKNSNLNLFSDGKDIMYEDERISKGTGTGSIYY